jgi:hypothetical protein
MKTEIIRVNSDILFKLKSYYESQLPEFKGKFSKQLIANIALEHALGNEIQIIKIKKRIKILRK